MTSRRRFNSLVHNLLDRAYFPYGFPDHSVDELWELCQAHGYNCVIVDLHNPSPLQQALPLSKGLLLGLAYLHRKYYGLLLSEGFTPADVRSATITYHFSQPIDDSMDEFFDVPRRGYDGPRMVAKESFAWPYRRKYLHAVNIRIVDDLGKLHQIWQMPYGCKRILKRPEKLENIKFAPNDEALNAPVLYVEDVTHLIPRRNGFCFWGCIIAISLIAFMALMFVISLFSE